MAEPRSCSATSCLERKNGQGFRPAGLGMRGRRPYCMTISTRRFCGSRTPSAVWTSGWPRHGRPRRSRSPARPRDQRVLDGVGAAQRQRHVVVVRTRVVGVAGRGHAGAAALLVGRAAWLHRRHRLGRQVRAIPVEEHHEGWRCGRSRRRRRCRGGLRLTELVGQAQHHGDVVVGSTGRDWSCRSSGRRGRCASRGPLCSRCRRCPDRRTACCTWCSPATARDRRRRCLRPPRHKA